MLEKWQPGNRGGAVYYDPQKECEYWIQRAGPHSMVAVPVNLLEALLKRRECSARTVLYGDEDGPLPEPVEIICRLPQIHRDVGLIEHFNGYTHWRDKENLDVVD